MPMLGWRDDKGNRYHDRALTHRIYAAAGPDGIKSYCSVPGCDWKDEAR